MLFAVIAALIFVSAARTFPRGGHIGGTKMQLPCAPDSPLKGAVFCNPAANLEVRVESYLRHVKQSSWPGQFEFTASALPETHMGAYDWWNEGLHGVAQSPGVSWKPIKTATSFPEPCLSAATFNRTLWSFIGSTVGKEGRSFHNSGQAGLTFWTPNINIYRDPRWGRGQETPGEDPYLSGEYAAYFVSHFQGGTTTSQPTVLQASACCKHLDAYSLEKYDGVTRHTFNAIVDAQDLNDTYLPAFESCIRRGHASGVMCSYNEVNGVPACADSWLMTTKVRNDWKFDGYITSDCGAVANIYTTHNYTKTGPEAVRDTLEAGMDIDCGGVVKTFLVNATKVGLKDETIKRALRNLFRVQARLGLMQPPSSVPWANLGAADVDTPIARLGTLEAVTQGTVMLKKSAGIPLHAASTKSVFIVGPNADAHNQLGNYAGFPAWFTSPTQAFQERGMNVTYAEGCTMGGSLKDPTLIRDAIASLEKARPDVVVAIVGNDESIAREGLDRVSIDLPGSQHLMIRLVAASARSLGIPVVVAVWSGGGVDIEPEMENPDVRAIYWMGYPGQAGGLGLASVLFGDVSPAGRLPATWWKDEYTRESDFFSMAMRPGPKGSTGLPGRTYRFYAGPYTLFPFGTGLSYTSWSIGTALDGKSISVKNTGSQASDYVALLFVRGANPGKDGAPLKTLVDFERASMIAPGETRTITFKWSSDPETPTLRDLLRVRNVPVSSDRSGTIELSVDDSSVSVRESDL